MDLMILLLILIIPAIAQAKVSLNYRTYKEIENENKLTGFEVARKILDANGLQDIHVVETPGTLTDHYDPNRKVVRLSTDIFHGATVASSSIAAHEVGHAIQDKVGYKYMRIRSLIFPVVNIATSASYFIILLGVLFQAINLVNIGIACTACGLIFQVVTLPVEINASKRAKQELKKLNLVNEAESMGVKKMLTSAALTYVAGVLASALNLIRLILVFKNED